MAEAGISTDNTQFGKKSLKKDNLTPKKDSPAKSKSKAVEEEEKKEIPPKIVVDQPKNDAEQQVKKSSGDGDPL